MGWFSNLLVDNPLLLLFVVAGLGFLVGRLRYHGFSLGLSAVLFTGIGFSAFDERFRLPELITTLGLAIFVYTLGLGTGPAFSLAMRKRGAIDNALVFALVVLATLLSWGLSLLFGFSSATAAGLFSGSLSSTPSLAAVVQALKDDGTLPLSATALSEPVVAYSVTYPASIFGTMVLLFIFQRWYKADFKAEARGLRDLGVSAETLVTKAVRVMRPAFVARPLLDLLQERHWRVTFANWQHAGKMGLVSGHTMLTLGDELTIAGFEDEVDRVIADLGQEIPDTLSFDQREFVQRRLFVSDPAVVGKRIVDLRIPRRFGGRINLIRRGDIDLLPTGDMRLELGDRVRMIARYEQMRELAKFFGDSYKKLSQVNIAVLSLGIAFGLFLGQVPFPLPDGGTFRLGSAGGPLLVGLLLGILRRTGPIVWHLPYSANLTLRQLGLIFFLAGVGSASGHAFAETWINDTRHGIALFVSGLAVTGITGFSLLFIGYRWLKIPMSLLSGILSGLQTQATVLSFASEQSKNDIPTLGYASVYPLALILKVILAQLFLSVID